MKTELKIQTKLQGSTGGMEKNQQVPDAVEIKTQDSIYIECLICHQPISAIGQRCEHLNDPVEIESHQKSDLKPEVSETDITLIISCQFCMKKFTTKVSPKTSC